MKNTEDITKVLQQISDKEVEQTRESTGWRSSGLGSCIRGRVWDRLLSGELKTIDYKTKGIFRLGHLIEESFMKELRKDDTKIVLTQGMLQDEKNNLSGHFDGLVLELSEDKKSIKELYFIEIKSVGLYAYKNLMSKTDTNNVPIPHEHYLQQIVSYHDMFNDNNFEIFFSNESILENHKQIELLQKIAIITIKKELNGGVRIKFNRFIKEINPKLIYIKKEDYELKEFSIEVEDRERIRKITLNELGQLNDFWEEKKELPPVDKTGDYSWRIKYCPYCQKGLCDSLTIPILKELKEIKKQKKEEEDEIKKLKLMMIEYSLSGLVSKKEKIFVEYTPIWSIEEYEKLKGETKPTLFADKMNIFINRIILIEDNFYNYLVNRLIKERPILKAEEDLFCNKTKELLDKTIKELETNLTEYEKKDFYERKYNISKDSLQTIAQYTMREALMKGKYKELIYEASLQGGFIKLPNPADET